jgi:hypothetical protein
MKKLLSLRGEHRQQGQHGVPSVARTQGHLPALYLAIIIWLVCLTSPIFGYHLNKPFEQSSPVLLRCFFAFVVSTAFARTCVDFAHKLSNLPSVACLRLLWLALWWRGES